MENVVRCQYYRQARLRSLPLCYPPCRHPHWAPHCLNPQSRRRVMGSGVDGEEWLGGCGWGITWMTPGLEEHLQPKCLCRPPRRSRMGWWWGHGVSGWPWQVQWEWRVEWWPGGWACSPAQGDFLRESRNGLMGKQRWKCLNMSLWLPTLILLIFLFLLKMALWSHCFIKISWAIKWEKHE